MRYLLYLLANIGTLFLVSVLKIVFIVIVILFISIILYTCRAYVRSFINYLRERGMFELTYFEWYDPDGSCEEDVMAFYNAAKEHITCL